MLVLLVLLICRLINWSGLRKPHSKVFSSDSFYTPFNVFFPVVTRNYTMRTPNSNVCKLWTVLSGGSNLNKLNPPTTDVRVGWKGWDTPAMCSKLCCDRKYRRNHQEVYNARKVNCSCTWILLWIFTLIRSRTEKTSVQLYTLFSSSFLKSNAST